MNRRRPVPELSSHRALLVMAAMLWPLCLPAADLLRGNRKDTSNPAAAATAPATVTPVAAPALVTAQDRLARATQTLTAVRQMQQAARDLAKTGPNNLRPTLAPVPVNSFGQVNGLLLAKAVPKDLAKPQAGEDTKLWVGANLPVLQTQTATDGSSTSEVTIKQTQQQALLSWDSFNIGRSTTLTFDQSAGGADVGQWVAFNKIGITGAPSQILGRIKAEGQVYIINPNGIIFGDTSQVNAHALVASSLPVNDRLLERGLLNNPDAQFLFSGLALPAGSNGPTGAFVPRVTDELAAGGTGTSTRQVTDVSSVALTYVADTGRTALVAGTDYTLTQDATTQQVTVALTPAGQFKASGRSVDFSYTPAASAYGDVEVMAGASIYSPTSADHVGGRVALIGPHVTNAGTLSSPDGQVIMAAGLQVGMAAHETTDPSLRGLDVFVGAVADPLATDDYVAGTVTNQRSVDTAGKVTLGLIETTDQSKTNADGTPAPEIRPGAVTLVGKTINQGGVIETATTVAFNGRVDLLANYNATANTLYDPTLPGSKLFIYPTGENTGEITLGAGSLIQITPSSSTKDLVNRTQSQGLALRSQVNLLGRTIHLASDVPATATTIPDNAAVAMILAPNAVANLSAGTWALLSPGSTNQVNQFLAAGGQVYLDRGTQIDVSGTQAAPASVSENIVDVQLRGAELADSPLQRDGPLRGQTVKVDLRVHGPWDQTLNGGLGGYTWVGTPLADTSGWIGLVQRTAGELTTAGGTVNVVSGGSVVMQPGAKIDVSGGWIAYQGGQIETTKLLSDGHTYDISQASPNRKYDAILNGSVTTTDEKWGVTKTTQKPGRMSYYDPGYDQGGAAGKVAITTASVALDGEFAGTAHSGARQLLAAPAAGSIDLMAKPGEFELKFSAQRIDPTSVANVIVEDYSPLPPNVYFKPGTALAAVAPVAAFAVDETGEYLLPVRRQDEVDLDPALLQGAGFGFLKVDNGDDNFGTNGRADPTASFGRVIVPAGTAGAPVLDFLAGSALARFLNTSNAAYKAANLQSLTLRGANIDVLGGIRAPGGSVSFQSQNIATSFSNQHLRLALDITEPDPARGTVTVGATGFVNVAGRVIDYREADVAGNTPVTIAGGQVALAGYKAVLKEGSTMDVSGGATIGPTGTVAWGAGGSIALAVANEQQFEGAKMILPASYTGAADHFALAGFSGGTGGELSIRAPLIQVGNDAPNANNLVLRPELFSAGGFASFKLTGFTESALPDLPGLQVGSATGAAVTIAPTVQKFQADLSQRGAGVLGVIVPEPLYQSRVLLSFAATAGNSTLPVPDTAGLVFNEKATVTLAPNAGSQVSFTADTIALLGSVVAPGGGISLSAKTDSTTIFGKLEQEKPLSTLYLGAHSTLSTAGAPQLAVDNQGYTIGTILDGGTIKVSGNIVAEKGALLDASGSTGQVDVEPSRLDPAAGSGASTTGRTKVRTTIDSKGGSIQLLGGQEIFTDATLVAKAGGVTATGGSLTVQSSIFDPTTSAGPALSTLRLTASGDVVPVPFKQTSIGLPVTGVDGKVVSVSSADGVDYFGGAIAASSFSSGGFDALTFKGNVEYSGDVVLRATGRISVGGEAGNFGGVIAASDRGPTPSSLSLNAPYVSLGTSFADPGVSIGLAKPVTPTYGAGTLAINGATLIDIGNVSFQGMGSANLATASGGDIRGSGTLDLAGDLTLTAGQIYPPTGATFTLAAYDPLLALDGSPLLDAGGNAVTGSITINQTGTATQVPLSAGGRLNVHATTITQNGTLRAPLGHINLGYDPAAGGSAPVDVLTGAALPTTQQLTLGAGSLTSVSLTDPVTGKPISLPVPYGIIVKGASWIDPTGADISVTDPAGRTAKQITMGATKLDDQAGSSIDIAGGGELYAYEWVAGTGGSKDVLDARASDSFAIIPAYGASFAPTAPYASAQLNLNGDAGYVSLRKNAEGADESRLRPGDSVYLDLNDGRGLRTFTLLPPRYALLPGAYLVTPKSGTPAGTVKQPDGTSITAGYRYNQLAPDTTFRPLYSNWEVAPAAVVRARAEYRDTYASQYFPASAVAHDVTVPRLPADAGRLTLIAGDAMIFKGGVSAQPLKKTDGTALGLGGEVDIASARDIVITGPKTDPATVGDALALDAKILSDIGADSLLVGGTRSAGEANETKVAVRTTNLTVDNEGQALGAPDVILVANGNVALAPGAEVRATGALSGSAAALQLTGTIALADAAGRRSITVARGGTPLAFPADLPVGASLTATSSGTITSAGGTTTSFAANAVIPAVTAGSTITLDAGGTVSATFGAKGGTIAVALGDGAALRVSNDAGALISRTSVASSTAPAITVSAGTKISGAALILDSTNRTVLDPGASLTGQAVALSSGQVSLVLTPGVGSPQGLVLGGSALAALQTGARELSLSSYSSIDFYGRGQVGAKDAAGQPLLEQLGLHAAEIRGFDTDTSGVVLLAAKNLTLDNAPGGVAPPGAVPNYTGLLQIETGALTLGEGSLAIDQFSGVKISAPGGVMVRDNGALRTDTDLALATSLVTGATGADYQLTVGGDLAFARAGTAPTVARDGIGAQFTVSAETLAVDTDLTFQSGMLALQATAGDLQLGGAAASTLDVSGTKKDFFDVARFTDGGAVSLTAEAGDILLGKGSAIDVSAHAGGGDAGTLAIRAPDGTFTNAGQLRGQGRMGSGGGSFALDVGELDTGGLAPLLAALNPPADGTKHGGFTREQSIRVRQGDVKLEGMALTRTFNLTVDSGNLVVGSNGSVVATAAQDGFIDALKPGATGGTINLSAAGSLTLEPGAMLSVAAEKFDAAGKGGAVTLQAGAPVGGVASSTARLDLQAGSMINLAVTETPAPGDFSGTLQVRAPQAAGGTDVQITALASTIINPSSIIVEGYKVYNVAPFGGVIDPVKTAVKNDGTLFATTNAAAITGRLTAGWDAGRAGVFHLQPGAEIINAADPHTSTAFTGLNPSGSSIVIPASGGQVFFPGTAGAAIGSQVRSTLAGTITTAAGTVLPLAPNTATTLTKGSTISLAGAGVVTFSGSTAVDLTVSPGANVTAGATGGTVTADAGSGRLLRLTSAGNSSITTTAAATRISFPIGTPGNDRVTATGSGVVGTITTAAGTTTNLTGGVATAIPAGAMVTLNASGARLTFTSGGTGGAIPIAIPAGTAGTLRTATIGTGVGDLALLDTWDFSGARFGPGIDAAVAGSGEPGNLALRAAGNLVFNYNLVTVSASVKTLTAGSLNDGFAPQAAASGGLWQARLLAPETRSWNYQLVAGADFTSANSRVVARLDQLPAASGSVLFGYGAAAIPVLTSAAAATISTSTIVPQYFQTIRTGTGDIAVSAGRDVAFLNPLATLYTSGTAVPDPTRVATLGDFDLPATQYRRTTYVGAVQQYAPTSSTFAPYATQYSYAGGNVAVHAQNDIVHQLLDPATGKVTVDSSKELPTSWLYRRGVLDSTGRFATIETVSAVGNIVQSEVASTSWWVDYSNFFEGVGALGGGNVSLTAGRNVTNVDAVVPTNARMAGKDALGAALAPAAANLVELGGGDLLVRAGKDIDAGVYYVERGEGRLTAGGSLHTNVSRTTLTPAEVSSTTPAERSTWMPTTLFLGKGSFDIAAKGDVLLGSAANPFLLPQGINNSYFQRSLFSTFAPDNAVRVSSLQGRVALVGSSAADGSLWSWYANVLNFVASNNPRALTLGTLAQPWLRTIEVTSTGALSPNFQVSANLQPGTMDITAFAGNIDLFNGLNFSPSPTGNLSLLAGKSVNGLGTLRATNAGWTYSTVNLSDADPARIPGVAAPLGVITPRTAASPSTPSDLLAGVQALFRESGETEGSNVVLQTQLALHGARPDDASGLASHALHGGDTEPVRIYAADGDVTGLTLFAPKATRLFAGRDVTDIGLYLQNARPDDVSIVAAGRDITAYNSNSALRTAATAAVLGDNALPRTGDIQISGPGTLEVFAGRNLDLGAIDPTTRNGLGLGITSIGNIRNPQLPFTGADIVGGAGLGVALGLENSSLNVTGFTARFLDPATGGASAERYLPELGRIMGLAIDPKNPAATNAQVWAEFSQQTESRRALLALDVFFRLLRDAGRNHNDAKSAGFGNFNLGYEAIATLFGRKLDFANATGTGFVDRFMNPATGGENAAHYLPQLAVLMGSTGTNQQVWEQFGQLTAGRQHSLALSLFSAVLADKTPPLQTVAGTGPAPTAASKAIQALFDGQLWSGDIALSSRSIRTKNGGDISLFAPGGGLTLGYDLSAATLAPPGILTEHGGDISILAHKDVNIGTMRIFTLRGGNEIIWSTTGNIAAGKSSKTVQSAPPTQVLVDPQSANVKTDLAGLATGGGIGVLATVAGVPAGDVDLIAPVGAIDAGDAGIRSSGNLNLAAQVVLNATNIQVGGVSTGTPPPPPAPNVGSLASAASASASANSAAADVSRQATGPAQVVKLPSMISVEVLGYGGEDDEDDDKKKDRDGNETVAQGQVGGAVQTGGS